MKVVGNREPLKQLLRWTQRILIVGAVSMLGYCGFVLADAWVFQARAGQELERRLHDKSPVSSVASETKPAPGAAFAAPGLDGLIGRIEIPRIRLSTVVFEGTAKRTLLRSAGHIAGSALPGQTGNIGIAGHRDTFFRPLKDIHSGDIITLTTSAGEYRYRVVSTEVVGPYDVAVLDPSGSEILTLVTCYPFYFVGSAPDRFIVRAKREL